MNTNLVGQDHVPMDFCHDLGWQQLAEDNSPLSPSHKLFTIEMDDLLIYALSMLDEMKELKHKKMVEVFPHINPKTLTEIIQKNRYKMNGRVTENDILLVLHDETPFDLPPFYYARRKAKNGIIVTTKGVYFSTSSSRKKGFLPWRIRDSFVSIDSFSWEKGFLQCRKLFCSLPGMGRFLVTENTNVDPRKPMEHMPIALGLIAEVAKQQYNAKYGIVEDLESTSYHGAQGDCPRCGDFMTDARLSSRGGRALARGFAALDRSMLPDGYSSMFGKSGGLWDSAFRDYERVCPSCGHKE